MLYPKPDFSRKSVHHFWASLACAEYQLDPDQLTSARMLLEKAKIARQLGNYLAEPLTSFPEVPGFTVIAWALPEMLSQWGSRICEVSLDSTCKYHGVIHALFIKIGFREDEWTEL